MHFVDMPWTASAPSRKASAPHQSFHSLTGSCPITRPLTRPNPASMRDTAWRESPVAFAICATSVRPRMQRNICCRSTPTSAAYRWPVTINRQ
jgi:hypothetical protein